MRFNRTVRTTEATIESRIMTKHPVAPPSGLTSHLPILMGGFYPLPVGATPDIWPAAGISVHHRRTAAPLWGD